MALVDLACELKTCKLLSRGPPRSGAPAVPPAAAPRGCRGNNGLVDGLAAPSAPFPTTLEAPPYLPLGPTHIGGRLRDHLRDGRGLKLPPI
jgi:hypothetical protein